MSCGMKQRQEKHLTKAGLRYFKRMQDQYNERKFVRKECGKGLSSNDFTDEYMTKLENVQENANYYIPPIPKNITSSEDLFSLTKDDVELNQTIFIPEENKMFFVVDLDNLDNEKGYMEYNLAPPEDYFEYVTEQDIDEIFEELE